MKLINVKQLSDDWGVSRSFIYTLVKRKKLKAYKVGGLVKFRHEDLEEYLASRVWPNSH